MTQLIPNGKQQFVDINGRPLVGGKVYFYSVGTSTPKDTFQDSAETILNTNPVILNARGQASIYGTGPYRQVLRDALNVQIWDQVVTDASKQATDVVDEFIADLANGDDPAMGDALVAVHQPFAGAKTRTQHDKNSDRLNANDFAGVDPSGLTDSTAGLNLALASGKSIDISFGQYLVSAPIVAATAGQLINGDGPFQARLKAAPEFVGSAVLILGNKGSTTVTGAMGVSNLGIDCSGVDGLIGMECYGLRDGTTFKEVYVTNNKNAPGIKTNMAGDGTGAASGMMCEGVQFQNCHVITSQDMNDTFYWQLDGLFESQLIGCKALGASIAAVSNTSGFRLGGISQTRGVAMIGCSAGNMPTANNFGIRYGQWARECWDQFTTFENIKGSGVYFHGSTVSGALLPAICRSLDPRPYNVTDVGVLDPLYLFGDANACYAGIISYYNSTKTWARFADIVVSQFNNVVGILAGTAPASVIGSLVAFNSGSANSNMVVGFSSDTDASRKAITFNKGGATERYEGNGFSEVHDVNWDTYNFGTPNKMRLRNQALTTVFSVQGAALGTSQTSISVLSNKAGTSVLDIVRIGAADSGGTGQRLLTVPN